MSRTASRGRGARRVAAITAIAALAFAAVPARTAPAPRALGGVAGGLWEVSRSASGAAASRRCVADPAELARIEHRAGACTSVVVADEPALAVIHYTCARGGFGQSRISVITPRTLRVETQGISGGAPFEYVVHARRVGNCSTR